MTLLGSCLRIGFISSDSSLLEENKSSVSVKSISSLIDININPNVIKIT